MEAVFSRISKKEKSVLRKTGNELSINSKPDVLRPLLAVNWIEAGKGVVPIEFDTLVDGTITDNALLAEIGELLAIKRAGSELDEGPRFSVIHEFIESDMATTWRRP